MTWDVPHDCVHTIESWPGERWLGHENMPGYLVSNLGRIWDIGKDELVQQRRCYPGFYVIISVAGRWHRFTVEDLRDEVFGIRSNPKIWPKRLKPDGQRRVGPRNKLCEERVKAIRRAWKADKKINKAQLAAAYGVSKWAVYEILRGRTWSHING